MAYIYFAGDDDYHFRKAEAGRAMKNKLGLTVNPLDGATGSVCYELTQGIAH